MTYSFQNEQAVYRSFTAGELKTIVGRKWRYREGTLAEKDQEKEKKSRKCSRHKMKLFNIYSSFNLTLINDLLIHHYDK